MSHVKPCECLAMLIADKVIREERTRKVHILGTFNSIFSQKYPTVHDTMHVYLALTDAAPGRHVARFQFVYIDGKDTDDGLEDKPLFTTQGPLEFTDKLQIVEFNMELRQVKLPRPGTLDIRFYLDDAFIAARRFRALQKSGGPAAPPAK